MAHVYSTYEAKAKFSEVIRKVRGGQRVVISYHGKDIAEILPIRLDRTLEERLERLEAEGALQQPRKRLGGLKPVMKKAGALSRLCRHVLSRIDRIQ